jgi:hypothetical protein
MVFCSRYKVSGTVSVSTSEMEGKLCSVVSVLGAEEK